MTEAKTKRTRVNLISNVTPAMLEALPNTVVAIADLSVRDMHTNLIVAAYNVAVSNPTWKLELRVTGVRMFYKEEMLGTLSMEYSRRCGLRTLHLHANRLDNGNARSTGKFGSKDVAPVLRKVREFVYPTTVLEKATPILNGARTSLYSLHANKVRSVQVATEKFKEAALEFVTSEHGKAAFLAYEAVYGKAAGRKTAELMDEVAELNRDATSLNAMRNAAGGDICIAARYGKGWVFNYNNEATQTEDEDDIPERFTNIQALKMVGHNMLIEGMGIRVGSDMYAVVPTESK